MIRRTPLKRSTKPIARSPIKRGGPPRKRRPGPPRRGPEGIAPERWRNPAYLRFLREAGHCYACLGYFPRTPGVLLMRGAGCDPAHGPVNGTGSKGPDAECIPLCREHHNLMHEVGWPAMQVKFGFSREAEAARWWAAFQSKNSTVK